MPPGGGYLVLRSTSAGGPYSKVSSGTCNQVITLVSAATSCTDTGLTSGTTYYYEVEAGYYDVATLWVSTPDAQFSGTTGQALLNSDPTRQAPVNSGPTGQAPVNSGPTGLAPAITSASSTSFFVGSAGDFQATASGTPASTFSNTAFSGCTASTLPSGVTFSSSGLLSGTPGANAVGTYTVCVNAANGVSPNATQKFTLTIDTEALVISSTAVSGATSSTPNLGPITVRRQSGSGSPITTGGALTVDLTSSPPSGATFGATQFASVPRTSVTIPSGQSTATFWYGSTTAGRPTITASATGYVAGPQLETITTAPAGLGMALATGSTGNPVISCGPPCEFHLQRDRGWDLWKCCLLRGVLEFRQECSRIQRHPGVDDQRDRSRHRQCHNQREYGGVESQWAHRVSGHFDADLWPVLADDQRQLMT